LELLAHVNKCVKAVRTLRLPLQQLVRLATGAPAPMVRSFALVYTETAVERAGRDDLVAAVSGRAFARVRAWGRCSGQLKGQVAVAAGRG
jgi:hypothetical protein